jgi:hypothetical protein
MFHPAADVVMQELDGEAVLLHLGRQRYFGLNQVGTRIWQLLEATGDPDAVIRGLEGEFAADRQRLEADAWALIRELEAEGLVQREPDHGTNT